MQWEQLRPVNGRSQSRLHVADYVLEVAQDFDQYGEYAADYWTVRVPPGRYPIYALRDCGRRWHSLSCPMDGVIVSGSWWNKLEPGTPMVAHYSPRAYALAAVILAGTASRYELRPGVEARRVEGRNGLYYNGEELYRWADPVAAEFTVARLALLVRVRLHSRLEDGISDDVEHLEHLELRGLIEHVHGDKWQTTDSGDALVDRLVAVANAAQ